MAATRRLLQAAGALEIAVHHQHSPLRVATSTARANPKLATLTWLTCGSGAQPWGLTTGSVKHGDDLQGNHQQNDFPSKSDESPLKGDTTLLINQGFINPGLTLNGRSYPSSFGGGNCGQKHGSMVGVLVTSCRFPRVVS